MGVVAPVLIIGAATFFLKHRNIELGGAKQQQSATPGMPGAMPGTGVPRGRGGDLTGKEKHVMTTAEYVDAHTPRIPGFPQTAPYYDEVNKVAVAPKPAACLKMGDKCRCYTQQATPLLIAQSQCEAIVQDGWFDDAVKVEEARADSRPVEPQGYGVRQRNEPPMDVSNIQQVPQQVASVEPQMEAPQPQRVPTPPMPLVSARQIGLPLPPSTAIPVRGR